MHPGHHEPSHASPHAMESQHEPTSGHDDPFTNSTNLDMQRVLVWSLVLIGVTALILAAIT